MHQQRGMECCCSCRSRSVLHGHVKLKPLPTSNSSGDNNFLLVSELLSIGLFLRRTLGTYGKNRETNQTQLGRSEMKAGLSVSGLQ